MNALGWAAALTVVVIWGVNFVVAKVAVGLVPPLAFMALRFLLVGLLLAPFFRPRRGQWPSILVISMTLGVLHFGLMFVGLRGIDAATAAIAIQLSVPFSAALAAIYFGERLGGYRTGGMALAFSGAALLAGEPTTPDPLSLGLVIFAAFAWAASNILIKRLPTVHPVTMNGWMSLLAAPQLLILSLALEDDPLAALASAGWQVWGALAFTVFGASIVAYSLWYHLLGKYEINKVVPFSLLAPVIGIASGVYFLGEVLSWQKMVGGVLTIIGVAIIQFAPQPSRYGPAPT